MARRVLDGRAVLITGASEGIGRQLAIELASRQCHVALVARRRGPLERVAGECRDCGAASVDIICADLTVPDGCRRTIAEATAERGLDALILNAGISHYGFFEELPSLDKLEQIMALNYFAPVRLTYHALPHLRASRGCIGVVSSLQGKVAVPACTGYAASKHAVHGFFDALRMELDGSGIDVTLACPGAVETGLHARAGYEHGASGGMSPARCATRVLRAIERREREALLDLDTILSVKLRCFAPRLVDRIIARKMAEFLGRPRAVPSHPGQAGADR